jgi:pimeloyl-ACP methyl ester carboxylesterase
LLAPFIGDMGSRWAARMAHYDRRETDLLAQLGSRRLQTPSLCFLATQDRLAPPAVQRSVASHFPELELVEVPTWHLNCSERLGANYAKAILAATKRWLP